MQFLNLKQSLPNLENLIRVKFKNRDLLARAFVHTSYINEHRREAEGDNERLEFLGDAVLELVTTEYLYTTFPNSEEGELTNFRSALVKGKHLAQVARNLRLGEFLCLSHGEEQSGGREKNFILANCLEALIGAIYLDRGFAVSHKFIDRFIIKNLGDILKKGLHIDAKSQFQELAQEREAVTPKYKVLSATGPDHDKTFEVGAFLRERFVGRGKGSSKQQAAQDAAFEAMKELKWI